MTFRNLFHPQGRATDHPLAAALARVRVQRRPWSPHWVGPDHTAGTAPKSGQDTSSRTTIVDDRRPRPRR